MQAIAGMSPVFSYLPSVTSIAGVCRLSRLGTTTAHANKQKKQRRDWAVLQPSEASSFIFLHVLTVNEYSVLGKMPKIASLVYRYV